MLNSIMAFQAEGEAAFWTEPLYHFYPQLDRVYASSLPFQERRAYIERTMLGVYASLEPEIERKTGLYSRHWEKYSAQISDALSEALGTDCARGYNDLVCNVSINPIEPRHLRERSFDMFYLNSERGALGESIHEIIHIVWFDVWHSLFHDSFEEYERPSLKWILSELVVEPIMGDRRLSSINPYYPREQGGCIYPYFFDMACGGELVLDTITRMYSEQPIDEFMQNSCAYFQKHEREIRSHIEAAERAGA